MRIKLNKEQLFYILSKLENKLFCHVKKDLLFAILEMDEDTADDIRDWAMDRLDTFGFDSDYELNEEGKILDQLIDIFYID